MLITKVDTKNLMLKNGKYKATIELSILLIWAKSKILDYQEMN